MSKYDKIIALEKKLSAVESQLKRLRDLGYVEFMQSQKLVSLRDELKYDITLEWDKILAEDEEQVHTLYKGFVMKNGMVEYADGDKYWWVNDKLHREGGLPAIEHANGDKYWYVNGKRLTKEQIEKMVWDKEFNEKMEEEL